MDTAFQYSLDKESVVFDVGGSRGDFTKYIREKFPQTGVHVFEPLSGFWKDIVVRFRMDTLVWPYDCALSDEDTERLISVSDNSTGFYGASTTTEMVKVRDIKNFILAFKLEYISLLKLNCEGEEYPILSRLMEMGWLPEKVKEIVVQFHHIPKFAEKEKQIKEFLSQNYKTMHQCNHWSWFKHE